jgi:hypothetical protein
MIIVLSCGRRRGQYSKSALVAGGKEKLQFIQGGQRFRRGYFFNLITYDGNS